jgi:two-component sensor histidine kinase
LYGRAFFWLSFALSTVLYIGLSYFDTFELLHTYTRAHENWNVDEFILIIPSLLLFFSLWSFSLLRRVKLHNTILEAKVQARTKHLRNLVAEKESLIKERDNLIFEVHHRVKNNLQIIYNLLDMSQNKIEREQDRQVVRQAMARIQSIILVHIQLQEKDNTGRISFKHFLSDLREHLGEVYGASGVGLDIQGEDFSFDLQRAVPVGLVLQELLSNAFKYAYPDGTGLLQVRVESNKAEITIEIRDNGPGLPTDFSLNNSRSLGLKLVRDIVELQLQGNFSIQSENGVLTTVQFPD